jgi:hypothetical protein
VNFRSCCRNPKTTFTGGPLYYFHKITQRSLVYENLPGRTKSKQCSPWAGRPHRRPNPRPAMAGLGRRAAPGAATDLAWAGGGLGQPAAASPGAPGGATLPSLRQWRLHGDGAARRTGGGLEATREEQGRDQDGEEMVSRRWWWGKGAATADLVSGGRRFRRPVALEDGHDDVAVLLGASARVRFDVGVVKCSAWPAGPACMRATRAAEACDDA